MHGIDIPDRDKLFSSSSFRPDDGFKNSEIKFSKPLPGWLWAVLTAALGIDTRNGTFIVSSTLKILTVTSAVVFAGCGLVFNVFDVMSELTKTTLLVALCKSLLGTYWVGMGLYARTLAGRLFSNALFVECIRMHTKTIFRINTALVIMVLSVTATGINIYWTRRVLDQSESSETLKKYKVKDGNCETAGVHVAVCEVYFLARIVFSCFNLIWNLLVASVLLSVCRTHTICIRRFIKELLYDNKIYEEFLMLQAMGPQSTLVEESSRKRETSRRMTTLIESNIWDNDINELDADEEKNDDNTTPDSAKILKKMRNLRRSRASTVDTLGAGSNYEPADGDGTRRRYNSKTSGGGEQTTNFQQPQGEEEITQLGQYSSALGADEELYQKALDEGKPPILSNEELLFTHFQLVRRLCSTSRLLQRWTMSIISFVLLWCALFIIYWTTSAANWLSIFEFIVPLVILYLLAAAYAEVNFEGERISRFVLPTMDRMGVVAHMQSEHPELKVYSFGVSYNAIMTVITGVAISFATTIVMEQILS